MSEYEYNELYELRKCKEIIDLNENSPMATILLSYRNLETIAAEMRCLAFSMQSIDNVKYFMKEMADINEVIEVYSQFETDRMILA